MSPLLSTFGADSIRSVNPSILPYPPSLTLAMSAGGAAPALTESYPYGGSIGQGGNAGSAVYKNNHTIAPGTEYSIVVGGAGGNTSAFGMTAVSSTSYTERVVNGTSSLYGPGTTATWNSGDGGGYGVWYGGGAGTGGGGANAQQFTAGANGVSGYTATNSPRVNSVQLGGVGGTGSGKLYYYGSWYAHQGNMTYPYWGVGWGGYWQTGSNTSAPTYTAPMAGAVVFAHSIAYRPGIVSGVNNNVFQINDEWFYVFYSSGTVRFN